MAAATATASTIRYAPEDPNLPKPWKGLVDSRTGYLYFWNPETNVTQYERPPGLAPPKPSPAPVSSSVQAQQQPSSGFSSGKEEDKYDNDGPKTDSGSRFSEASRSGPMNSSNAASGLGNASSGAVVPPPSAAGIEKMSPEAYCRRHEITVTGGQVPPPLMSFEATGFPPELLREEETDPYRIPNKQNLRMALYWLVQGCTAGDSLVFHYSGHGSRQRNYNGDEVDGYDETLCPLDFETQGMIVDDEINATIVRPLPHGVKLHSIIDACHSGTVLDLPFLCRMNRSGQYVWEDHRPRSGLWKGTAGGEAISISGCDDDQTSADTSALKRQNSLEMSSCVVVSSPSSAHYVESLETEKVPRQMMSL